MSSNPALELAYDYTAHTNRNLFVTGKAGTGKTTFLHRVRREVAKEVIVAAPTGIAAVNAGAQTIHSLFSLPFGFLPPNEVVHRARRLSRRKATVLRAVDLLIIDEVSMVRADVLDAIDRVLRKARGKDQPFGGAQVLLIGDLHQLPPVVTKDEHDLLAEHYATPFFFSAKVMRAARPVTIPLTRIYRQRDERFIGLLNKVRQGAVDRRVIDQLNARYVATAALATEENRITLTSHNRTARQINLREMDRRPGKPHRFRAVIEGKFPKQLYPNDPELAFKIGAQVMFNRNDTTGRQYFNGKIGRILAIHQNLITVQCPGEDTIDVTPVVWEHTEKTPGDEGGHLKEVTVGTFEQHPLRLAWAITIHKSQGLTFDKVTIDAGASFDHGQVYVALSRCRTLEGIQLSSRLSKHCIRTNRQVADHSAAATRDRPTDDDLLRDRRNFQLVCLQEIFDFQPVERLLTKLAKHFTHPHHRFQGQGHERFLECLPTFKAELFQVAGNFLPTITRRRPSGPPPEEDETFQQRLRCAATYFTDKLAAAPGSHLTDIHYQTNNTPLRTQIEDLKKQLQSELHLKLKSFDWLRTGFTAEGYTQVRTKARAPSSLTASLPATSNPVIRQPTYPLIAPPTHPDLERHLREWRLATAKELNTAAYTILPNKPLVGIAAALPVTHEALLRIHGFGPKSLERHGEDILAVVRKYTRLHGLAGNQLHATPKGTVKQDTYQRTLHLLRGGQSIQQVATARKLKEATIYGHALRWLRKGKLRLEDLLPPERLQALLTYTSGRTLTDISLLHHEARGRYSFGELRLVLTPV